MTNGEWLEQKFTNFTNWLKKHAKSITVACWLIVAICLAIMLTKQSLMPTIIIIPIASIGTGLTAKCIVEWLDAEHEERKENKE